MVLNDDFSVISLLSYMQDMILLPFKKHIYLVRLVAKVVYLLHKQAFIMGNLYYFFQISNLQLPPSALFNGIVMFSLFTSHTVYRRRGFYVLQCCVCRDENSPQFPGLSRQ